jgi:sugar lactone lactonase YvrE
MAGETRVLLDGLAFGEGPRWHDGKLWFSDMHFHRVMAIDHDGHAGTIVEVAGRPSGLGWLPDGRLLIVSMVDRRLLRLDPDGLKEVADLSRLASSNCNDMVVDSVGRAYIGNFGFDFLTESFRPAEMVMVEPDGAARVVANDLAFPNGTVITPDGRTMIVGETYAARLTAFDIAGDGSLSNRRLWAQLEKAVPDGICLDAEGAIWVASPNSGEVIRVLEGGEVTRRVKVQTQAFACMLGGEGRRTLFILTAETSNPEEARQRGSGRVEVVEVDVPGAGLP